MAETPSFVEGEEEAQYVFVAIPPNADAAFVSPGATLILEDLATEHPKLRLSTAEPGSSTQPTDGAAAAAAAAAAGSNSGGSSNGSNGAVLEGQYVDSLGSILLVKEQPKRTHKEKSTFTYVGHTDKQLQFKPPT